MMATTHSHKHVLKGLQRMKATSPREYPAHKLLYDAGFFNLYLFNDGILVIIDQTIPDGEMILTFVDPKDIPTKEELK